MIKQFVTAFVKNKDNLENKFKESKPISYRDLVKVVIETISKEFEYALDLNRITEIDYGYYEGTVLYIIAEKEKHPNHFWYVKINYNTCSACDTLQRALEQNTEEDRIKGLMTLSLHIVQKLKHMGSEEDMLA